MSKKISEGKKSKKISFGNIKLLNNIYAKLGRCIFIPTEEFSDIEELKMTFMDGDQEKFIKTEEEFIASAFHTMQQMGGNLYFIKNGSTAKSLEATDINQTSGYGSDPDLYKYKVLYDYEEENLKDLLEER